MDENKLPNYILGPKNLFKLQRYDRTILLFGEYHIEYENYHCNGSYERIYKFLHSLFSSKRDYIIDFYLENTVYKKEEYEGEFKRYTDFLKERYSPEIIEKTKDIEAVKKIVFNCIQTQDRNCKYKNIRVHGVDLRLSKFTPSIFYPKWLTKASLSYKIDYIRDRIKQFPLLIQNIKESKLYKNINNVLIPKDKSMLLKYADIIIRNYNIINNREIVKDYEYFLDLVNDMDFHKIYTHYRDNMLFTIHSDFILKQLKNGLQNNDRRKIYHCIDDIESDDTIKMIIKTIKKLTDIHHDFCDKSDDDTINSLRKGYIVSDLISNICDMAEKNERHDMFNEVNNIIYALFMYIGTQQIDLYTVSRMLRSFTKDNALPPTNIIYYGGNAHTEGIKEILFTLGFYIKSFPRQKTQTEGINCIDISEWSTYDNIFNL